MADGGSNHSLARDVIICLALHFIFIGTGIEAGIYDFFGAEHAHGAAEGVSETTKAFNMSADPVFDIATPQPDNVIPMYQPEPDFGWPQPVAA